MKTKPFLLATAGSTVDGRTIDDTMLQEMADSYNPATYGARLNIEHIRGMSGDKPFKAYGDVVELSVGETEVDFNGKKEKRKALFGVFDVTDDAKALNDAGQKVYPSIEIEPNFGGKGFAYLMGCALTDSPAAIGTEKLKFNRALPGVITLTAETSGLKAAQLEPAEEERATEEMAGAFKVFLNKLTGMIPGASTQQPTNPPADRAPPAAFDVAAFTAELGNFGTALTSALETQASAFTAQIDSLRSELNTFKQTVENTPDKTHQPRPLSTGSGGQFARTDC